MSSKKFEPTSSDLRKFAYMVGGVLALVFGLAIPYLNRGSWNQYLVGSGSVLVLLGTILPRILYWPYRIWMLIGEVLGWINTRIILSVIFFLLFTPIGLIRRLFGSDSLKRKLDADATSYRVIPPERTTDHMERPF